MRAISPDDQEIAVICDRQGIVRSVVRDDLDLSQRVPAGASIVQLADVANAEKADNFLLSLQSLQTVFDWEISVPCQEGIVPLHFTGGPVQDGFLVVASRSSNGLARVNEELMRINKEQANALCTTTKKLSGQHSPLAVRGGAAYDELTRVNNDLANLQRELFRKNIELAKSNELKNQFLGMAAHDLRTPLGVIMNYANFLQDDAGPVLSEQNLEFISTIRETSEFMLHLIDNLLDVSQFEAGKLRIERQPVDLAQVVRHNLTLNRVLAAKKQIRLLHKSAEPLPLILLDRGKIEQVLNNLISNALKFSHVNTEISVHLTREDNYAVITIADEGQGIPAEDFTKLFKPFSRTRVKTTGGESSTGLGLSIVSRIVEGHGGEIGVTSQVGKGTTFRVRLPLNQPAHGIALD